MWCFYYLLCTNLYTPFQYKLLFCNLTNFFFFTPQYNRATLFPIKGLLLWYSQYINSATVSWGVVTFSPVYLEDCQLGKGEKLISAAIKLVKVIPCKSYASRVILMYLKLFKIHYDIIYSFAGHSLNLWYWLTTFYHLVHIIYITNVEAVFFLN